MNNLSPEKDDLSTNKVDNPFHRKKVNFNIKKLENILSIIASETDIPSYQQPLLLLLYLYIYLIIIISTCVKVDNLVFFGLNQAPLG